MQPSVLTRGARCRFRRAVRLGLNAEPRFQRFVVWMIESLGRCPRLELYSAFGAKRILFSLIGDMPNAGRSRVLARS
jgi:hypothetical protein